MPEAWSVNSGLGVVIVHVELGSELLFTSQLARFTTFRLHRCCLAGVEQRAVGLSHQGMPRLNAI